MNNLIPFIGLDVEIPSTTEQLRQKEHLRTSLYNNFFTASDKYFADEKSNLNLQPYSSSRFY